MYRTKTEYERVKGNCPEYKLPEWGTLACRIIALPIKMQEEHNKLILRYAEVSAILQFLEFYRKSSFLSEEENNAVNNLFELLCKSDSDLYEKLGLTA